jgi:UDP-2,3-diacylglucosamine pyrophosphatase LpxH
MSSSLPTPVSLPPAHSNYLLFSDVHLGADLVQHARPWTVSRLRQVLRLDRELSGMLEHYRAQGDPERPWKLIIAGDLVDFMGMSIAPVEGAVFETPLTAEERTHGLGSARDHAVHKMRAVAVRHDMVFRKLAQFVADGHSLVLIRGNHDVEFYWDTAREAFVQALLDRAPLALSDPSVREAFQARIEFRHWFYYVEGLLYVEHGHQYDETCSYHHVLMPLSPRDPSRIAYSFSDILMRYVVRPTRGMGMSGHDGNTMGDYVRLAFSFGLRGAARLGYRFGRAVLAMLHAWRGHAGERATELRAEHERLMRQVAERWRMSADKLGALSALSATPVTGGFFAILRSVFLDLLAAITASALLLVVLLSTQLVPAAYVAPVAVLLGTGIYAWMKSSRVIDQCAALRQGAARVAALLPARFVVMGHTHAPVMESIAEGVTYVNLGAWAVDDIDAVGAVAPASCTHLVIRHVDGQPHAELRRWCIDSGASVVQAMPPPAESGVHPRPHSADEQVA